MNKRIYYAGEIIGNGFEFVRELEKTKSGQRKVIVKCPICKKEITKQLGNINYANSIGCISCAMKELSRKSHINDIGYSNTKLYRLWKQVKDRCNRAKNINYKHYGGRGIKVCNEWANDFMIFHDWSIANGYKEGLTLDRIDVNGNYEPTNCRWVSMKEQQNNRRNNVVIEGYTLSEIAQKENIDYEVLHSRYKRNKNITYEELTKEVIHRNRKEK